MSIREEANVASAPPALDAQSATPDAAEVIAEAVPAPGISVDGNSRVVLRKIRMLP
jgi:hypothetical protein